MVCCNSLNIFVLGFASTLYLVLGLALVAASGATFFTAYGEIFTPIYAGTGIGVGLLIFLVSVIGYLAACKQKKCWLSLFMLFDIIIIAVIVIMVVLMFRYEDALRLASEANLDEAVTGGLAALNRVETTIVRDVVNNAFSACDGNTTISNITIDTFDFSCSDSDFEMLGATVDRCMASPVNATIGTIMYSCYTSPRWPTSVDLGTHDSGYELLPVLQTPKGLYCACASAITNEFILRYITTVKFIAIGVGGFFILIFLSCCYLCCAKKSDDNGDLTNLRSVELTHGGNPQPQRGYQVGSNARSAKGGFVARP